MCGLISQWWFREEFYGEVDLLPDQEVGEFQQTRHVRVIGLVRLSDFDRLKIAFQVIRSYPERRFDEPIKLLC